MHLSSFNALILLQYGADINAVCDEHKTSVSFTCISDDANILSLLISHGADINIRDNDGRLPWQYACMFRHEKCLAVLKKHGAKFGDEAIKRNQVDLVGTYFRYIIVGQSCLYFYSLTPIF